MSDQFKAIVLNQEGENFSREVKSLDFTLGMLGILPGTILYCSLGSLALRISSFGEILSGRSNMDSFIWSLISIFSTILVLSLIHI